MSSTERLAEASGLSVEEVEVKIADGFVYFRDSDYFGGVQPPGEWLDAKGTEYVVNGLGQGQFSMYWGKGDSIAAAKAEFRKYGGVLSKGYSIIEFGPGSAFVGIGGGGYRWVGEAPTVSEVAARKSKARA